METSSKKGRSVVVTGVVVVLVIAAIIGAFYLIRTYTGFGGFPTIQIQSGNSIVVHASTNGTGQYLWTLSPQIVASNHGTAAASNVKVVWSISGGPIAQGSQGLSEVGTILPGSSQTVSWTFHTGGTAAPFSTYIITATFQYAQGPNIVETITLTPTASCAQTAPGTTC